MEKIKTILDRKPLSSDYIRSKQDFAKVMNGAKGLSKPYWKSNWFYGTVGVATVAIIVSAITLTNSETPKKDPAKKKVMVAAQQDQSEKTTETASKFNSEVDQTEDNIPEIEQEETQVEIITEPEIEQREVEAPPVQARVEEPEIEEKPKVVEIASPNIAGVTGGPIAFKDFCDPLGIQVGDGILIYRYTIQYRSCARDVTARVSGNKLPYQLCPEIKDCGAPIEVNFSKIEAYDRDNNKVELKDFSLVTSPR